MVFMLRIPEKSYDLGPSRGRESFGRDDFKEGLDIREKCRDVLNDLGTIVKDTHVASIVEHTRPISIDNSHLEYCRFSIYGEAYELPDGAVFISLICADTGKRVYLYGDVVLAGDEGFKASIDDSELAQNIKNYFRDLGIELVGEFYPKGEPVENP